MVDRVSWRKVLTAAADVAGAFAPGVAAGARVLNAFIGPDQQLLDPQSATGADVMAAYEALPPDRRAEVAAQLEETLARESVDKLTAMVSVETATANTRPAIADRMAWVIALGVGGIVVAILIATYKGDTDAIEAIGASWELMAAALGIPAAVVRAYFGDRSKDKHARYAASQGQSVADVTAGALSSIIRAVRR